MRPFRYAKPTSVEAAIDAGRAPGAQFLAGGTTLVDLMRLDVMQPGSVIDLGALPLAAIRGDQGGVRIGATARNTDVAHHPLIAEAYPVLAEALLAGASPQVRNMATVGGNLLQRTRCSYFRDPATACNKRAPGTGCSALDGYHRGHAVLGCSSACIATHPSDMAVALVALDAVVHVVGPDGPRAIPIGELHALPGDHPEIESTLAPGELITEVELPARRFAARSTYLKVRDRASFAFALASAAVAVELVGGTIREARVALGGVATKPWRSSEAEAVLVGQRPTPPLLAAAADAALGSATPRRDNGYKVELARRTIKRALARVTGMTPGASRAGGPR
jgi:xanthine dehydrogenase YagS FAD-binding subunit